jgi:hypothetical protein
MTGYLKKIASLSSVAELSGFRWGLRFTGTNLNADQTLALANREVVLTNQERGRKIKSDVKPEGRR